MSVLDKGYRIYSYSSNRKQLRKGAPFSVGFTQKKRGKARIKRQQAKTSGIYSRNNVHTSPNSGKIHSKQHHVSYLGRDTKIIDVIMQHPLFSFARSGSIASFKEDTPLMIGKKASIPE